ncbi:DUF1771-domain-containing protein [Xylaria bambusicola]|uniref:DUF1771-domain-containing protein n=1 Tax=Xylaria bambusicola TaxID=326684 RepID=UPI002008430A|nr:DUF1771-domain-containing protein [Xylaria bambusicola]KAI0526620.1 DUF1771-domain-containing protein [Xylaria bambusicola]
MYNESDDIELHRPYADRGFGTIGGSDFNHAPDPKIKAECERLRRQAREADDERNKCFQESREAYNNGDGARAKQLSNEGKKHGKESDDLDEEASNKIFKANNPGYEKDFPLEVMDLHGQLVHEAVKRVADQIQTNQQNGLTHLHVIVGKGIHSAGHVQKLKPAIEDLCRDMGLHYETEENAGRIYVDLQGDHVPQMPPLPPKPASQHAGYGEQPYGGYQQQDYYPGQQQQHHGGQTQQEEQYDEIEKLVTKLFKKYCCTVM